jgi:nicotinamide mononucleotide (NMN) deamidase PncC
MLQLAGENVAILESNTAGNLAERLVTTTAEQPVVTFATTVGSEIVPESLARQLAAVVKAEDYSEAVAARAASDLRAQSGAAYALVILGTAGESEGVYGSTSGRTWIGLATPMRNLAVLVPFGGNDDYTVTLICNHALRLLWEELRS